MASCCWFVLVRIPTSFMHDICYVFMSLLLELPLPPTLVCFMASVRKNQVRGPVLHSGYCFLVIACNCSSISLFLAHTINSIDFICFRFIFFLVEMSYGGDMCSMSYTIRLFHMLSGSDHTVWLYHFSDAKRNLSSGDAGLIPPLKSFSSTFQLMVPPGITKY